MGDERRISCLGCGMTDEHERGRREGVLRCAKELRAIAQMSREEFAEAFRSIAEAWEKGVTPSMLQVPCGNTDFGD